MKFISLKLLAVFLGINLLSNISGLTKKKQDTFGYASNENILQNASVKYKK
jgi:hypothetical protein